MKKGIILCLMLLSASLFAAPKSAPVPQTSSQVLSQQQDIRLLQKTMADLQALVMIQGEQINSLMKNQKQIDDEFRARLAALETTAGALSSQAVPTVTQVAKPAIPQPSIQAKDAAAYQAAYQFVQQRKYSEALKGFANYVAQFPNGAYLANAYYWIGEIATLSGNNEAAHAALVQVVKEYPKSSVASESLLKLGQLSYDQRQYDSAQMWWHQLIDNYPNSSAAQLAKDSLQKLKQSGTIGS